MGDVLHPSTGSGTANPAHGSTCSCTACGIANHHNQIAGRPGAYQNYQKRYEDNIPFGAWNWRYPRQPHTTFADVALPSSTRKSLRERAAWFRWSYRVQEIMHTPPSPLTIYNISRFNTRGKICLPRGHQGLWFSNLTPRYENDQVTGMHNAALQCERCGLFYDLAIKPLQNTNGRPVFQLPFVFCPGNQDNTCATVKTPTATWTQSQEKMAKYYEASAEKTIEAFSELNPTPLLAFVLGPNNRHHNGVPQLRLVYKALRVLALRAFTAASMPDPTPEELRWVQRVAPGLKPGQGTDAPNAPENNARRGRPVARDVRKHYRFHGEPSFWGDIRCDLDLLDLGLITKDDLTYVYGVTADALLFLRASGWENEMDVLDNYVGMRQYVDDDQYLLMRTACQRANTAMTRVLDAVQSGAVIIPGCEHLYASNGLCFQELHSAMSADLNALRSGRRVTGVAKPAIDWRLHTSRYNGRRVYGPFISSYGAAQS